MFFALIEDRFHGNKQQENLEDTDEVKHWSEQWRLVVGRILQRDIELTPAPSRAGSDDESNVENENKNDSQTNKSRKSTFIELTDNEFKTLKAKCIKSLDTKSGRLAFALILNRQRNSEYGKLSFVKKKKKRFLLF